MENNKQYRFTKGKDRYVVFNSNGYIVEAKGFDNLIWSPHENIDKQLTGKHVNELAKMLKKNGVNQETYLKFEAQVHVKLLEKMQKTSN